MKIKDRLSADEKKKPSGKEQYSRKEGEEIMGAKRDTYKRVGDSIRRK
jgi:hypothetical protein